MSAPEETRRGASFKFTLLSGEPAAGEVWSHGPVPASVWVIGDDPDRTVLVVRKRKDGSWREVDYIPPQRPESLPDRPSGQEVAHARNVTELWRMQDRSPRAALPSSYETAQRMALQEALGKKRVTRADMDHAQDVITRERDHARVLDAFREARHAPSTLSNRAVRRLWETGV